MKWFISFVVLGTFNAVLSAKIKKAVGKDPPLNCTEFFANLHQEHLNTNRILGPWYHVSDDSEHRRCIDFEKLSNEYRKTLAEELEPYTNETDFERFSFVVKRSCVSMVNYNDTDFHLLEHISEGIFDAYYVPHNRSDIYMFPVTVLIRLLVVNGKEYMGILPCQYLVEDESPDVFEKSTGDTYTAEDVRDLEFMFNDNRIFV